jgi:hypothetical protein
VADGFVDGVIATVPMSAFMLLAQRVGAMGKQPPAQIAEAGLHAAGAGDVPRPAKKAASALLHFAFGGVAGATFAAWARRADRRGLLAERRGLLAERRGLLAERRGLFAAGDSRSRAGLAGAVFGSMVWAASYMGWVPALGIMPPAHRDRPDRPWSMLTAHWIYGATLGLRTAARAGLA